MTVHDLIFIRYPELYNPLDVFIYKAKVKAACQQADKILATSIQTKSDIVDFLNIDPAKIDVVYQGCHPSFKRKFSAAEIEKIKTKYKLPESYILNVGTIEERKNVLLLVKALSRLPKDLQSHVVDCWATDKIQDEDIGGGAAIRRRGEDYFFTQCFVR